MRAAVGARGFANWSKVVGFPERRERGPEVRDWALNRETISPNEETGFPLNDETRFPLRGDWRTDFSPPTWCRYATSSPRTVFSQQTRGDVQADLQRVTPEHLVLHAVRAPTWLVGRPSPIHCAISIAWAWLSAPRCRSSADSRP